MNLELLFLLDSLCKCNTDSNYWTINVVDFVVLIPACEALAKTEYVPVMSLSNLKEGESSPSVSV